jgi:hypothetical protein
MPFLFGKKDFVGNKTIVSGTIIVRKDINMETSWEKLTDELIREIAGEIEKDRRGPQGPLSPENPTPGQSGLASPEKLSQGAERT